MNKLHANIGSRGSFCIVLSGSFLYKILNRPVLTHGHKISINTVLPQKKKHWVLSHLCTLLHSNRLSLFALYPCNISHTFQQH